MATIGEKIMAALNGITPTCFYARSEKTASDSATEVKVNGLKERIFRLLSTAASIAKWPFVQIHNLFSYLIAKICNFFRWLFGSNEINYEKKVNEAEKAYKEETENLSEQQERLAEVKAALDAAQAEKRVAEAAKERAAKTADLQKAEKEDVEKAKAALNIAVSEHIQAQIALIDAQAEEKKLKVAAKFTYSTTDFFLFKVCIKRVV